LRARTLYKQVVLPGLLCGASMWQSVGDGRQSRIFAKIERTQNQCLQIITGEYKAMPIEMIHSEAPIKPVRPRWID